jgi:TPR repeat protein
MYCNGKTVAKDYGAIGAGVEKDTVEAVNWYGKAATQEDVGT